jgi:hypothetical protein
MANDGDWKAIGYWVNGGNKRQAASAAALFLNPICL